MRIPALTLARTAVNLSHDSDTWDVAFEKALMHLMAPRNVRTWYFCAGKLFALSSKGTRWHVVKDGQCDCPAGKHGRLCWHKALYELLMSVESR